jgi:aspartate/methionine/tyrosine aminotransferase
VRPLGYTDGVEFCRDLPQRCGVVAIPHQVFYDDLEAGKLLVRFAFCKRDEVLDDAVERLQKAALLARPLLPSRHDHAVMVQPRSPPSTTIMQ